MTNTNTENTNTTPATTEAAAPKAPSKKSQAVEIFKAKLAERSQGLFGSNKEFRAAVLTAIQAQLGVSVASAATMYNSAKKDAETADASVKLGRDPKKEKVKSTTGKRGRPVGSKNKPKAETPATEQPAAPAEQPVAAEATA